MNDTYPKTVVSRTNSAGQVCEVVVDETGVVEALIDGSPASAGARSSRTLQFSHSIPQSLRDKGAVGAVGAVLLRSDELEAVMTSIRDAQASYDACRPVSFLSRRESLKATLDMLREKEAAQRSRAWEEEDESRAFSTPKATAGAIAEARRELAEFDSKYPYLCK